MANNQKVGTAELLFRRAKQMGLQPSWVTHDGLFAVTLKGGAEQYVHVSHSPLNSHVSASLAKNKYLTRLILARHDLPNIPFARPLDRAQALSFLAEHRIIIVKPLRGFGAQDIHIVTKASELTDLDIQKYIFEKYVAGKELRYLVLNDQVIGVYESEYGTSVEATRTLQCFSYPEESWDPALREMSIQIAQIIGLRFAAVDYLVDAQGYAHILEVNSTPDLRWFHAPTSGPPIDVAGMFLEATLNDADRQANSLNKAQLGIRPLRTYS